MWRRTLERWLAAEQRGRPEEAEEALRILFREVPRFEPAPGFADRVLAGAGLARHQAQAVAEFLRAAVVLALLAMGLFAVAVWTAAGALSWPGVLARLNPVQALTGLVGLVGSLVEWMLGGFAVWSGLAQVSGTVARIAATPTVTGALVVCALISILAFRALQDLVVRERSWTHA
jgi:hypothetical protein